MISFNPEDPYSLEVMASRFFPGTSLKVQGREFQVSGLVVCRDAEDAWLEVCLAGSGRAAWLAIEHKQGGAAVTLWKRSSIQNLPDPFVNTADSRLLAGTADFWTIGTFGDIEMPLRGTMQYLEIAEPHRVAERFERGYWLIGKGSGRETPLSYGISGFYGGEYD